MKSIFLGVAVVFGVAVFGSGQTAPDVSIRADSMTRGANRTLHLAGGVEIALDGVRVTADEADLRGDQGIGLQESAQRIELRGNVTLRGVVRERINVNVKTIQNR